MLGAGGWVGAGMTAEKPIPTPDDPVIVLGTLTCTLAAEAENTPGGSPTGAGRDVQCNFQPGQAGPQETYVGSVQGVGQSKLLFGRGAVILYVKGPTSTDITPGLLTQSYAVDAAAGGSALAPLVGESNRAITLQPLAEDESRVAKGKTQPEAVLILVELKLKSSPG
jgi:hypothetical protein